jgi:hydrogenase expression/formation protein HypE
MTELITLEQGAGGEAMQELIDGVILKYLNNANFRDKRIEIPLDALDDAAVIDGIVFTTDSHTVKPLFFPGGDIGRLAVSGTINDIAVMGAEPLALSSAFVIEEGFPIHDLQNILEGMRKTCEEAEVPVITGDTKVMEHGTIEKMIVNTSSIGKRSEFLSKNMKEVKKSRELNEKWIKDSNLEDGDRIIASGTIGDHGIAIISSREGYGFGTDIVSDVTPLNGMIAIALEVGGIVAMKDPTRGGVANALNELSSKSNVGILINEEDIPIRGGVRSACEMLGIDVLEIGNEGKVVMGVVKERVEDVLNALKTTKEGKDAEIIGEVRKDLRGVVMKTSMGGKRIIDPPIGDPVPRIC